MTQTDEPGRLERDALVVGLASTGLILGSAPHKFVHRSSVPVLVVTPDA